MNVIEIRNLTKIFNSKPVLSDINLDIKKGEIMVIIGGSGAGKTTLLKHMVGLLKPTTGSIFLKGQDITEMDPDEFDEVRKKIGVLFQSSALFNSMTIGDNIALPLREHTQLDEDVINVIVKMMLELVGLEEVESFMPSELSGGMKKRVGLARAIVLSPEVIFYDEPGSGLDPIMTAIIDHLIKDLTKKLGVTSIVVTHDMNSAFRVADRITMLYEGKIIEQGTVEEIKNTEHPVVRQFITGSPEGPVSI